MSQNKVIRFGPVALTTTTTTNIINPPTLTGGTGLAGTNSATFLLLKHIRVVNVTNAAASFALWLGLTGANTAGTEVIAGGQASGGALTASTGVSVAANGVFDWYSPGLRIDSTNFLVGGASAGSALTLTAEGEIGIA